MSTLQLLGQFGTDFEMIARLFPTRTRGQIKAKWMKEEKINSAGVTVALMSKKPIGSSFAFGIRSCIDS